jgi:hypothetical protein
VKGSATRTSGGALINRVVGTGVDRPFPSSSSSHHLRQNPRTLADVRLRDMGTHRPGSRRSLSSGPELPEAPPTYKWVRRPYPQSRRPWKTSDDLIQTPEDQPGLWRKLLPRSRCGAISRSMDRGILSVITKGDLPNM